MQEREIRKQISATARYVTGVKCKEYGLQKMRSPVSNVTCRLVTNIVRDYQAIVPCIT